MDIAVKRSGWIDKRIFGEGGRGSLLSIEAGGIPFEIQRVYAIYGVTEKGAVRGEHAHKKTDQAMFIIAGALSLHLDDGVETQSLRLTALNDGVRLGPLLWHSMSDFTPDCVALVVASAPYDEADYIHEYAEFKKYASTI